MFSAAACKEHYIAVSETHNLQEKQNQNVLGYLTYRDISHVSLWIGFGSAGLFPSLFFINHHIHHHQQELETRGGGRVSSSSSVEKRAFFQQKNLS